MKLILVLLLLILACNAIRRFPKSRNVGKHYVNPDLPPIPTPTTYYFDQYLDHFNYMAGPLKWKQRVLVNTQYWNATGKYPGNCPGPIFFYSGNEDDIDTFWYNSGFITQVLAPKHNAMLVFAEHRYFGKSLPFGNNSFNGSNVGWLSPEQAMADYAYLITEYKENVFPNASKCPVFTFGGSYGGMLSAWLRFKYPNVFMAGFAASAPLAFDGTGISPYEFMDTAQNTYSLSGKNCDTVIASALRNLASLGMTQQGRTQISNTFKTCSPYTSYNDIENLLNWIENGMIDMAMLDYPYPTNYGVEFPGWPVNTTCSAILSYPTTQFVEALAAGMQSFFNYSGNAKCLNVNTDVPNWGVCCGWNYLACTEIYLPFAQRGMWYPETTWNVTSDKLGCVQEFGVGLRPNWGKIGFGGFNITTATNILFSNGLLDPWHTSGFLKSPKPELPVVVIPASGHHLDLRAPNPADPISITLAREEEASYVEKWLNEYFQNAK
eukprot:TRINITY_DN3063_c0_g1_i1.p1 TRINITY_DN3063_c0_g1~~TRINITY_DN3063_c0_g1_i1.p1  ORF type:complete len:493 (+),score=126.84 TRINITY_DN3063_c0_g1_i1:2-1480(+)